MSIFEFVSVDTFFYVLSFDSFPGSESYGIDFVIEVTNISNNCIIFHLSHMVGHDDMFVSCGGDKNISFFYNFFKSYNFDSVHTGLQGTDRVDFSNIYSGSTSFHGLYRPFTYISVSTNYNFFTCDHNISSSENTISKRVSATINIIKF